MSNVSCCAPNRSLAQAQDKTFRSRRCTKRPIVLVVQGEYLPRVVQRQDG
jgi:hypothetical protein